jgi:hypothetical protein
MMTAEVTSMALLLNARRLQMMESHSQVVMLEILCGRTLIEQLCGKDHQQGTWIWILTCSKLSKEVRIS